MNNGYQKNINFTFENLLQDKGYKIKYDKGKISIIKEKGKNEKVYHNNKFSGNSK